MVNGVYLCGIKYLINRNYARNLFTNTACSGFATLVVFNLSDSDYCIVFRLQKDFSYAEL